MRTRARPRLAGVLAILSLSAVGLSVPTEPLLAQAGLSLTAGAGMPGETVELSLLLSSSPGATAIQIDLSFDSGRLTAGAPIAAGGLSDHLLASVEPQPGLLRLVLYSPTNALLPAGEVVRVPFTAAAGATPGAAAVDPVASEVATPAATEVLPLSLSAGSIHIFTHQADLSLQLAASSSLVANGNPLFYTLEVRNPGPDAVTSVEVTDLAPAKLSSVTWTCAPSGGASCTSAGINDVVDTIDLPVGGSAIYTLIGTVDTGSTFVDNLAALQAPDKVFDPDLADNSDSVSVDICVVDNLVLEDWDIGGVAAFNACLDLTAGPNFNVQPTGEVTLRALGSVVLGDAFSVESGGRLTIETP